MRWQRRKGALAWASFLGIGLARTHLLRKQTLFGTEALQI